jgi:hypothetical protein
MRQELKLAGGQMLVINLAPNGLHDPALRMLLGTEQHMSNLVSQCTA